MRKITKILLAVLGAGEVMFSVFIPISLSLLLVKIYVLNSAQSFSLIAIGFISSLYRALSVGFINR